MAQNEGSQMNVHTIHAANFAVAAPTVATIFGYLPTVFGLIATVGACVVYGMQIYDWIEKRRAKNKRKEAVAEVSAEKLASTVQKNTATLKENVSKLATKLEDSPTLNPEKT